MSDRSYRLPGPLAETRSDGMIVVTHDSQCPWVSVVVVVVVVELLRQATRLLTRWDSQSGPASDESGYRDDVSQPHEVKGPSPNMSS